VSRRGAPLPIVSPDDQKVTFVELFFDLVFVFSVTQVVHLMHGHIDLASAGAALLVFWLVWWSWTQFTWALNAANTDHPSIQLLTLIATAIAFLLAVGIPHALDTGAWWFAIPYVALRTVGLLLYYWVAWADPDHRRAVATFGAFSISGLIAVLVGAMYGGAILYLCWAAAIALDLFAALVGAQREGWNLHPEHFVERHGLIVIIALGETLIVAAAGLVDAPRTPVFIATGILSVAVLCGLWWTYFPYVRPAFEHALAGHEGSARSSMARDVFSIIHFPMLCGVIGMAVATEEALARPDAPLALSTRMAMTVGAALFVCGTAVAIWRAVGRLLPWRWVLAGGTIAVSVVLPAAPWVVLVATVAMLAAVAGIERLRFG
jgi:low temperature requirement protein LtrA